MLFINFLEELTKTWINTLFSIYSATKLFFQLFISVLHKVILLFRHKFMICSRKWIYPASNFCKNWSFWKRDSILKLVYTPYLKSAWKRDETSNLKAAAAFSVR